MTNETILELSKRKLTTSEAKEYLSLKEMFKSTHMKVLKDTDFKNWFITTNENTFQIDFGFLFIDYLNQILSIKDKESFISYEKRIRSGAKTKSEVSPTYDKGYRYFLWNNMPDIQELGIKHDGVLTDSEYDIFYEHVHWLWDYIENDVNSFIEGLDKFLDLKEDKKQRYIPTMYYSFNILLYKVLFIIDSKWDITDIDSNPREIYKTDEAYNEYLDEQKSLQEYYKNYSVEVEEVEENILRYYHFIGYGYYTENNNTHTCEKYDVISSEPIIAEDFMFLIRGQFGYTLAKCKNCNSYYVSTHKNQCYCPSCLAKKNIYAEVRAKNPITNLEKKIGDILYNQDDEEYARFKKEKKYYKAVISGKDVEPNSTYKKIKTEKQYLEWLEKKHKSLLKSK